MVLDEKFDDDFDDGEDDEKYVCTASGITGNQLYALADLDTIRSNIDADLFALEGCGKDEKEARKALYPHLLACADCRAEYVSWVRYCEDFFEPFRADLHARVERGQSAKEIEDECGIREEVAAELIKGHKERKN